MFCVLATQSTFFAHEIKTLKANWQLPSAHAFSRLTPFIDNHGVIRVGGRLNNSFLTQEGKHPVILLRHSRLSDLIIADVHLRTLHGGTQLTLAFIRQSHWIIGGRAPVKSHILRCVVCARQRGIRAHQLMGQLPLSRVTLARPFTHTGVDYAGPLNLKTWKGRVAKVQNGWISFFVCFTTSAVHLDAVTDYSTDGFIATYRSLYSDQGTHFIGAEAILKRLFTPGSQDHHVIAFLLSEDNAEWYFNPPAAPHMGGKWEAAVKSIKFHLRRTVSDTLLTYEELATLLTQIEAILNSRPLEPLSDDPEVVSALTPGHFLISNALTTLPEPSITEASVSSRSRWRFIQQRTQQFWSLRSAHYLQRQQSIAKWHHPANVIKVGSLVFLTDERLPPCKWLLARVTELHPGTDELTRVVTIKTATTTLTRPVAKLVILPVTSDGQQETSSTSR